MKKKTSKKSKNKFLTRASSPGPLLTLAGVLIIVFAGMSYKVFSEAASSAQEHIIATLYAYPTEASWNTVESAAPTVNSAIVNICAPDGSGSGCGRPADEINPDWVPTIKKLKADGIKPLYYISTEYDAVPLATVESELLNAKNWYGVVDPMFDTTSTSDPAYYSALYNYAVNKIGSDTVVFNPGTTVPQSYLFGSKEIIQVFEGTAGGFEGSSFPAWIKDYPASQFAATLSAGSAGTIHTDVADAVRDGIGNFYEDDEAEPPNYSTLPTYWATEVSDVAAASGTTPKPTPVPTHTPVPTVTPKPTHTPTPTATPAPSPAPQTTKVTGAVTGIDVKCLDNYHSLKVNGNKIQLFGCNGTGAQRWTLTESTRAVETEVVNSDGYCLTVRADSSVLSTPVVLSACNSGLAQLWYVNSTNRTIVNVHSGLCLDDRHSGTANGTQIQVFRCNGTDAQKWTPR